MSFYPQNILLQWHITERCNLKCLHCYSENNCDNELSLEQLVDVVDKIKAFLCHSNGSNGHKTKAHINITGGEVFIRPDFIDFLNYLYKNKSYFSYGILSNGTLIDKKIATQLNKLDVKFVQVSLDGNEETHDKIRGKGNFVKVLNSLKILNQAKLKTIVSFTAMKSNYKDLGDVVHIASRFKVSRVWTDRFIPIANSSEQIAEVLSAEQTQEYIKKLSFLSKHETKKIFSKTEVATHRALQFIESYTKPYRCSAGNTLITILSDGQICPCRRMPIKVGNILDNELIDIYQSNILRELRDLKNIPSDCKKCDFSSYCSGGLRCLSYAIYHDPFQKDIGCWLAPN